MVFHKYIRDSKMFEYDKYYCDCKQENKPFIKSKINPHHGNYHVQLDLATCDFELSEEMQVQIHTLLDSEIKHIKDNLGYNFKRFCIDRELSWFDGIASEHVDDFCNALYDIVQPTRTV